MTAPAARGRLPSSNLEAGRLSRRIAPWRIVAGSWCRLRRMISLVENEPAIHATMRQARPGRRRAIRSAAGGCTAGPAREVSRAACFTAEQQGARDRLWGTCSGCVAFVAPRGQSAASSPGARHQARLGCMAPGSRVSPLATPACRGPCVACAERAVAAGRAAMDPPPAASPRPTPRAEVHERRSCRFCLATSWSSPPR